MDSIGKRVAKKRREMKMTQEALAARLGVSKMVISRLERGAAGIDVDRLQEIALALGCSAASLLDDTAGDQEQDQSKTELTMLKRYRELSVDDQGRVFTYIRLLHEKLQLENKALDMEQEARDGAVQK